MTSAPALATFLPEGLQKLAGLEASLSNRGHGNAEKGRAMLNGLYDFATAQLHANPEDLFSRSLPGAFFARRLHGFGWLEHLASLSSNQARSHARLLVAEWMAAPAKAPQAAAPEIMARRLVSWLRHLHLLLAGADEGFQKDFLRHLGREGKLLARRAGKTGGADLITAGAGLFLAGEALGRNHLLQRGRQILEQEMARQILPDGGHISRNPELHLAVMQDLLLCRDVLLACRISPVAGLVPAIDRMRPMLGFLAHGDGRRAVFHGGNEGGITTVLADKSARTAVISSWTPHSHYRRLAAEQMLVIADCGGAPPAPYHLQAHASPLAFEMSYGENRIVVNCGTSPYIEGGIDGFAEGGIEGLRGGEAHSGLLLGQESPLTLSRRGALRGNGTCWQERGYRQAHRLNARHDFYAARFGRIHERQLSLHPDGCHLAGQDRLLLINRPRWHWWRGPWRGPWPERVNFSILFHLHPDLLIAPAHEGEGIFIRPPGADLWRFDSYPLKPVLEPSLYCGAEGMRASQRLVLHGAAGEDVSVRWRFTRLGGK